MEERCERQPGTTFDFRAGGRLAVVALWWCPGGSELRVVRWQLRGRERALYGWARGQDFPASADAEMGDEEEWIAGVALERREHCVAAAAMFGAEICKMPIEGAVGDHLGDDQLIQVRHVRIRPLLEQRELLDDRRRGVQPPEAKAGSQHF